MSEEGNGLQVSGPGGTSIKATGRDVILVLLLLALAVLVYRGFDAAAGQHAAMTTSFDRIGCLFSLPEVDRLEALQTGDPCGYALGLRGRRPR